MSWTFQELVPLDWLLFSSRPSGGEWFRGIPEHVDVESDQLTEQLDSSGWEVLSFCVWFNWICLKRFLKIHWFMIVLYRFLYSSLVKLPFWVPVFDPWKITAKSVLGDGDKIGGVEFLHESALAGVQIKTDRKAQPGGTAHQGRVGAGCLRTGLL